MADYLKNNPAPVNPSVIKQQALGLVEKHLKMLTQIDQENIDEVILSIAMDVEFDRYIKK
jgi:hypothetical protein